MLTWDDNVKPSSVAADGAAFKFLPPLFVALRSETSFPLRAPIVQSVQQYLTPQTTTPRDTMASSASMFEVYLRYIANRSAVRVGMKTPPAERIIFETRVIEYQARGTLSWN